MNANAISNDVIELQNLDESFLSAEYGKYFVIDSRKRTITPPSDFVTLGVVSDADSERVWFECPRYVGDNVDLTKRNLYINYQNANGEKDRYYIDDVTIDGENVHFSWELRRKALTYKGDVKFIFCAIKPNSAEEKGPEWNTTLCTAPVLEGLEVENPLPDTPEYDIINQLISLCKEKKPDWEQSDPMEIDYIKNKPFYTETEVLMNQTRIVAMEGEVYVTHFDTSVTLKNGDVLIVEINNKANVETVKIPIYVNDDGNLTFDNISEFNGFDIINHLCPESLVIVPYDWSDLNATLTVYRIVTIKKMDEVYLPDSVIKAITSPDASGNILHIEDLPKGSLVLKGEFAFGSETIVFEDVTQCHLTGIQEDCLNLLYFSSSFLNPNFMGTTIILKQLSSSGENLTHAFQAKNIETTGNKSMFFDDTDINDGVSYPCVSSVIYYTNTKFDPIKEQLEATSKNLTAVESIAKGANQALSFQSYEEMINVFNDNPAVTEDLNVGQNIMIVTLDVPDLWVYFNGYSEVDFNYYTYTTDEAFVEELKTNGYVHVGFLKLSALETQKVDLTDVEKTSNKIIHWHPGEDEESQTTYPSMMVMSAFVATKINNAIGTVNAELESILAGGVD